MLLCLDDLFGHAEKTDIRTAEEAGAIKSCGLNFLQTMKCLAADSLRPVIFHANPNDVHVF